MCTYVCMDQIAVYNAGLTGDCNQNIGETLFQRNDNRE